MWWWFTNSILNFEKRMLVLSFQIQTNWHLILHDRLPKLFLKLSYSSCQHCMETSCNLQFHLDHSLKTQLKTIKVLLYIGKVIRNEYYDEFTNKSLSKSVALGKIAIFLVMCIYTFERKLRRMSRPWKVLKKFRFRRKIGTFINLLVISNKHENIWKSN